MGGVEVRASGAPVAADSSRARWWFKACMPAASSLRTSVPCPGICRAVCDAGSPELIRPVIQSVYMATHTNCAWDKCISKGATWWPSFIWSPNVCHFKRSWLVRWDCRTLTNNREPRWFSKAGALATSLPLRQQRRLKRSGSSPMTRVGPC